MRRRMASKTAWLSRDGVEPRSGASGNLLLGAVGIRARVCWLTNLRAGGGGTWAFFWGRDGGEPIKDVLYTRAPETVTVRIDVCEGGMRRGVAERVDDDDDDDDGDGDAKQARQVRRSAV